MNERRLALALRQQVLLQRSEQGRTALASMLGPVRQPLALADRLLSAVSWLRAHPEGLLAAVAVLAVLRPRRVWRWGLRLWSGYRLWRRAQVALWGPGRR